MNRFELAKTLSDRGRGPMGPLARKLALAAALGALALGVITPAAGAYSFSIGVSAPANATVGRPVPLQVNGVNPPPAEYWFNSYFSVEALPASVFPMCPAGHEEGSQAVVETVAAGGTHVTPVWVRERVSDSGAWLASLAYTPRAAGRMLLCAYTNDAFTHTLARASTAVDVRSAKAKKRCKKKVKRRSAARKKCRRGR
jgi:hypothetical protein